MPHFYRQPSQSYELSKTVRFFGPPCTHSLYPTFAKSFCYVLHQRNWCSCFCSCDSDGKLILCERYALQLENTAAFCPTRARTATFRYTAITSHTTCPTGTSSVAPWIHWRGFPSVASSYVHLELSGFRPLPAAAATPEQVRLQTLFNLLLAITNTKSEMQILSFLVISSFNYITCCEVRLQIECLCVAAPVPPCPGQRPVCTACLYASSVSACGSSGYQDDCSSMSDVSTLIEHVYSSQDRLTQSDRDSQNIDK